MSRDNKTDPENVHHKAGQGPLAWYDGQVTTQIRGLEGVDWVVTSPNMNYIPQPYIGIVTMSLMKDARYGTLDPIQHPQIFSDGFEYLAAIYRRPPDNHPYYFMWSIPCQDDFAPIEGSVIKTLGYLKSSYTSPLHDLVLTTSSQVAAFQSQPTFPPSSTTTLSRLERLMKRACDRLIHFAATLSDARMQCAELQRYWLMCHAFMTYARLVTIRTPPSLAQGQHVLSHLMGAFTTSPTVVQMLFDAGIPVWFMRQANTIPSHARLLHEVVPHVSRAICNIPMDVSQAPIYMGIAGSHHLQVTCRSVQQYRELSHAPLFVMSPNEGYAAPRSQREHKRNTRPQPQLPAPHEARQRQRRPYPAISPTHVRGRDKFVDIIHEWMPATLPSWVYAMRTVAQMARTAPARPSAETWGTYFMDQPGPAGTISMALE
ncbi:hypothetical protein C8Q76DRAFT_796790 [Earliella scabrosa]|nr:hypothetical protein C8Q76DRAFT_796790 [Earliella scabrosa]